MSNRDIYKPKGQVIEISAKSGVSFELNGTWYKSEYTETRVIPEEADIELERQDLWNTVNCELDRQVDEVYKT